VDGAPALPAQGALEPPVGLDAAGSSAGLVAPSVAAGFSFSAVEPPAGVTALGVLEVAAASVLSLGALSELGVEEVSLLFVVVVFVEAVEVELD
jgi:hypothetical protein